MLTMYNYVVISRLQFLFFITKTIHKTLTQVSAKLPAKQVIMYQSVLKIFKYLFVIILSIAFLVACS